MTTSKEQKFYKALQDVFIGAKIEGKGGFVNLMKIKSNYYRKIEDILKKNIDTALKTYPSFRDELFDKLYSFFSRYFTESGSIYFNSTPFHNNIYEKVYTDEKDVILFWKTQMLYYVKTDRIFRSLPVEFDGFKFYFDASKIESKRANEKRSLIFELNKILEDNTIVFDVQYSERGAKTKQDEILKTIKRKGVDITEEQLERAFRVFEKQSEVDFFINKNAKAFLQEQFKLWSYQYFWEGAKEWSADRVNQLQILKDIAFKIIDFISQFEDELVKIWNKPKFVKNSNYVITLDRINKIELIEKILKHENIEEQVKEWQELGIVDENFKVTDVFENDLMGRYLSDKYQHLPIDTKYFKDLELEILSRFEDLDKSLDGWLIKSENYQALNTILPKFKEKVQTIYIDPPFNTGDDFEYVDRFQDSTWLTLMHNRIQAAKDFLKTTGGIFLHLDWNAQHLGRLILESVFSKDNFINEIIWRIGWVSGYKTQVDAFVRNHDTIYIFSKTSRKDYYFKKADSKIPYNSFDKALIGDELSNIIKKWGINNNEIKNIKLVIKDNLGKVYKIGLETASGKYNIEDTWNCSEYEDLHSNKIKRNAKEYTPNGSEITQKPEQLLQRIISLTTNKNDIIFDFFSGSGTTIATAHKLGRKWIGVEMGKYYETDILFRMKQVLCAHGKNEPCGISKEVNWQGGGFFKYYELEQYEEALANCKYEDGDLFNSPSETPYQEYVFMKDEKMLECMEIDYENNKVKVDLDKLYPNIDIAETLSNLTGKWIKKISDDEVEFEDGAKINTKDLDYKLIKPLIWWE
jgi:adenine specific DNA methylase Mod